MEGCSRYGFRQRQWNKSKTGEYTRAAIFFVDITHLQHIQFLHYTPPLIVLVSPSLLLSRCRCTVVSVYRPYSHQLDVSSTGIATISDVYLRLSALNFGSRFSSS
jgi:hypothetical protein